MTGDLFNVTRQKHGPWTIYQHKFEEISYVKRITRQEAQVALRDHYKEDLMDHEYESRRQFIIAVLMTFQTVYHSCFNAISCC